LRLAENSDDEIEAVKNMSISTSSAQNDGGLFELNFRDERYLPFEGAGAISNWKLELPATLRSFNYDTISDVIFHVRYTAKADKDFREQVEKNIADTLIKYPGTTGLFRMLSLKYDFPSEFYQLLNSTGADGQKTYINIQINHFPYFLTQDDPTLSKLTASKVSAFVKPKTERQ
jgi:hypothetical protein